MRGMNQISSSEITPQPVYQNRRRFMELGIAAASLVTTGWVYRRLNRAGSAQVDTPALAGLKPSPDGQAGIASGFRVDEPMTPLRSISNYNNFYEFTTDKESVSAAAAGFVSKPWQVAVGGMVHKPKVFDLDELMRTMPLEERVYRMRCVEGWSMVIPWSGFPLAKLLERVEPMGSVEYVAFQTLLDPGRMPGQKGDVLRWPYIEGLRMDEAMHPLTLLAVGLYGRELPAQNGAPLRLVVPWKYGFKGIKSIVKITLVSTRPATTWNTSAPHEYGFYSNVNPEVDHPRWSQATEQRIGESGRRPTLMFNGYGPQVAHLYAGMNLRENF
jgi:methionine sulfoxide reductase catalytic subunit